MHPDDDGKLGGVTGVPRPVDVQEQAVLTDGLRLAHAAGLELHHAGACRMASLVPVQPSTGAGAAKRRSLTGGAA